MYNKVIMQANLTRDVETKQLPSGSLMAKLGIASNHTFKDARGEQKEETCFVDVTLFGRQAEVAQQYLKKGSKVLIEGRLQFEQWSDQNGQKRSKHSIIADSFIMLDTKSSTITQQDIQEEMEHQGFYDKPKIETPPPATDNSGDTTTIQVSKKESFIVFDGREYDMKDQKSLELITGYLKLIKNDYPPQTIKEASKKIDDLIPEDGYWKTYDGDGVLSKIEIAPF